MKPYQKLVAEEKELSEKLIKLQEFFSVPGNTDSLDHWDLVLLELQYSIMLQYVKILRERIRRFK